MFYVDVFEYDTLRNELSKEKHKVYDVENCERGIYFLIYNEDGWEYVKSERCRPHKEVY